MNRKLLFLLLTCFIMVMGIIHSHAAVTDTWSDWSGTAASNTPPGNATPEIDDELRNIKAQIKANVMPVRYFTTEAELSTLLTAIGSDNSVILTDQAIAISADTTIPANVILRVNPGGSFAVATTKTLTINGPIEAGPYQIFSWTGTGAINISDSPTAKCPIEWWGAVSGTDNDISAALGKAIDSVTNVAAGNYGKTLLFSNGTWRIASAITKTINYGLTFQGESRYSTVIYCDTAGDVTLTIGNAAANSYSVKFKDMTFGGPTACCTSALVMNRVHRVNFDDVNFWAGSTSYVADFQGCIWLSGLIKGMADCQNSGTYDHPAYGIRIAGSSPSSYASNVVDLVVQLQWPCDWPLYMDGTINDPNIVNISGSIEAYSASTGPFYLYKVNNVSLHNLYCEGAGTEAILEDCHNVRINTALFNDDGLYLSLKKTLNVEIANSELYSFRTRHDCRGTVIRNSTTWPAIAVIDEAPDTEYIGYNFTRSGYIDQVAITGQTPNSTNYCWNSGMERWDADSPTEMNIVNGTLTQCGTGLADTTNHNTTYCTKLETTNTTATFYNLVGDTQLKALLGRVVTYSAWINAPIGQDLDTSCALQYIAATYPARVDSTAYKVGEGVAQVTGTGYHVCLQAGTTDSSEPTWATTNGDTTTDGTVIWYKVPNSNSNAANAYKATYAGNWHQSSAQLYVPSNATALSCTIVCYDQTDTSAATYYIAEPMITIGNKVPAGFVPSNSLGQFTQVGEKRMWPASPAAGTWIPVGDVDLSTGQRCTVAGVMGSATWSNFP